MGTHMIPSPLASSGGVTTLQVLVVILPILGALLGAAIGRWSDARNRRREQYADAVRVLVRWAEYPYRIRRRTSDEPDELRRLAELGHDLQEQLQCHNTWIQAENHHVGLTYANAIATIKARTGNAAAEAWQAQPATTGPAMVLNDWGPSSIDDVLSMVNRAVARRFGWRRLVPFANGRDRI
jgi:hypothetical protein